MMKDRMIQNGIEYERRGEQYYPLLDLGEQTTYEIGKYGKLHLAFMKQHRRGTLHTLVKSKATTSTIKSAHRGSIGCTRLSGTMDHCSRSC